jgi:hypothetical protein
MGFSGELWVLCVCVLVFFWFYLVFDVGAAHSWELVGNSLEISWGSFGCAWPMRE